MTNRSAGRRARRGAIALSVGLGMLAIAACGGASAPTAATSIPSAPEIDGVVDIGAGRQIYAQCRGSGSPTVFLISGKGNGAADWSQILDPDDPAHDAPGDDLPVGLGTLVDSDDAVLPVTAELTRVCAYDRPDIRVEGEISTPRPQPHSVEADVADLHALTAALGESGPKVLVAHSYGGLIALLYARTYPDEVAGLVMVDAASEFIPQVATEEGLRNWADDNAKTSAQLREGVQLLDAFERIAAAPELPAVPAVVLVADKPWRTDLLPPELQARASVTFDDWRSALDRLAVALDATEITDTRSGHDIHLYSPALVIGAIRDVVDEVRDR